MKIINDDFLKARSDPSVSALSVVSRTYIDAAGDFKRKSSLQLTIEQRINYTHRIEEVVLEVDADVLITYGNSEKACREDAKNHTDISFFIWVKEEKCHLRTFLREIKKGLDVSFLVIAFDECEIVDMVTHELYGIIGKKVYLLSRYTGPDNAFSPVR